MKDIELTKRLYIKNAQKHTIVSWEEISQEYNEIKGTRYSPNTIRHYLDGVDKEALKKTEVSDEPLHHSERYIEIGTSERLNQEEVIMRHGLDPAH